MATMKAVVFRGQDRIAIEEVPKPVPKAGEAVIRITATTICGTDVHIVRGEYPVRPGLMLGHEPVGVIEELGAGPRDGVRGRAARDRRRDHAVRAVLLLPQRRALAVRRRTRRLALRQHDQRRVGRVPAGSRRAREPRADSRHAHRRRRTALSRHLLDGAVRRRERQHPGRRYRRRLRAGTHRTVRDARRKAEGRLAHHRRRFAFPNVCRWRASSARTSRSTCRTAIRSPRSNS